MATAMQDEGRTVADRQFRSRLKEKDDLECHVLAKVVLSEYLESLAKKEPNGVLAFARGVSASAEWAIEWLGDNEHCDVSLECRDTRMFLCGLVIAGWISGTDLEVERRCARTLRSWPTIEAEEVSKLLRKHLESTVSVLNEQRVIRILGEFFVGANPSGGENEIWRTVFKAIARYSDMQDLVILGQAFGVLQKSSAPLRDLIKRSLAQ